MDTLPLNPLPFENSHVAKAHRRILSEGFVDESVVLSVIARGPYERVYVQPEGMVLSSSEDDYAGWALPVPSPFRRLLDVTTPPPAAAVRQPAPPTLNGIRKFSEPGIAEPHSGIHRWWLFGISGAMTCGIFSLTLLSLAQRSSLAESIAGPMPAMRNAVHIEMTASEPEIPAAVVRAAAGE